MASRPTLQVFQTLGLMPTPPLRNEPQFPPSLRTAVRGGPAATRAEAGAAPAHGRAPGGGSDPVDSEREALGER